MTTRINPEGERMKADRHNSNSLLNSRLKAAKLFHNAILTKRIKESQLGIEDLFLADLYRRAGDFQSASQVIENAENKPIETSILRLIEYEKRLIHAKDTAYYQIDQALLEN
ncbi:MAG: hypothetical protein VKK42_19455 [Lyngbya sp.]|nr:hypothetical protein [Lyngbya sp.]